MQIGSKFIPSRINVVGASGSGKSFFSKRLAALLGNPYVQMDALFWKPGWCESEDEEFFPLLEESLKGDSWVLDGNYNHTLSIKWKRVQWVIWLDYSFPRTLIQAFKRAITRIWSQRELWPGTGNRETILRTFFSSDSILLWTLTSYSKVKKSYESMMTNDKYAHIVFVRLRTPIEAEDFLQRLKDTQLGSQA